jgi:hypothetical protein
VPKPSGSRKLKPQGGIKDSRGRAPEGNVNIADIADAVGRRYESAARAKRAEVEESMLCEMSFADLV